MRVFLLKASRSSRGGARERGSDRVGQTIPPTGGDVTIRPEEVAGGCAGSAVAGAGPSIGHGQGLDRQRGLGRRRPDARERIGPLALGAEPYAGEAAVESGKQPAIAQRRVERRCTGARCGTLTGREAVGSVEWGS